ncbi:MAG: Gfo/Idh/MocA family oxidoreductase [Acidimicrobiales bacterium]|nr:Gfo/Idh/MocA family oxidoreductase [Acidimicrobiales bacterium]
MTAEGKRRRTVGIVGAGEIVASIHLPVLLRRKDVTVAYVADTSRSALVRVEQRFGVSGRLLAGHGDPLPETDAVLLSIPIGAREHYYEQLVSCTGALYLEKPVARAEDELMSLVRLLSDLKGPVVAGYQRRMYANVRYLARAVSEGALGRPLRLIASEGGRTGATGVRSGFRDDVALSGGGVLMDLGCHAVDLAHWIMGSGAGVPLAGRFVFDEMIDRDVRLDFCLDGSGGTVEASVAVSWLHDLRPELTVVFEDGSVTTGTKPAESVELVLPSGERRTVPALGGASSIGEAFNTAWSVVLGTGDAEDNSLVLVSCLPAISFINATYQLARRP